MARKQAEKFNDGSDGLPVKEPSTVAEQLAAAKKELESLRARIKSAGLRVPREIPKAYLFTMSVDAVEKLQLEEYNTQTKNRKLRKHPIAPFHVTGCSLGDGKMYYFDIANKAKMEKLLTEKEMAEFTEVDDVMPSEHLLADDLSVKMTESKEQQAKINDAKGVAPIVKEIVPEE